MKNPEVMLKAQNIVDEVVGNDVLSLEHVPQLEYVSFLHAISEGANNCRSMLASRRHFASAHLLVVSH